MYGEKTQSTFISIFNKPQFSPKELPKKPLSPSLKYIAESNKNFHYSSKVDIKFYFSKYQNFSFLQGCLLSTFANLINEVQWSQLMSYLQSSVIIKERKKNVPAVQRNREGGEKSPHALSILENVWQKFWQCILLPNVQVTVRATCCVLHSFRENIPVMDDKPCQK